MPNTPPGLKTLLSAAAATANGAGIDTSGFGAVLMQVTGTFVATITWEVSLDGDTFVAVRATNLNTGAVATTTTTTGLFLIPGGRVARPRVSAYTSGSVTVKGIVLDTPVGSSINTGGGGASATTRSTVVSAANTAGVLTVAAGVAKRKVLWVSVAYSAAPPQPGVPIVLDSGAGAGYDVTLLTGSADVRYTFWLPTGTLLTESTDALVVTAPAGGAGITSSIACATEEV